MCWLKHPNKLSVALETEHIILESMLWLKQQNGKQETEHIKRNAKPTKRQTAETDGTTILSCTPETDTSESHRGFSVASSKGLSLPQWIFTGNVQWILTGIVQWVFTFLSSGVQYVAPNAADLHFLVGFQWHFPTDLQRHFPVDFHFYGGISQRVVAFPVDAHWTFPRDLHFSEFWRASFLGSDYKFHVYNKCRIPAGLSTFSWGWGCQLWVAPMQSPNIEEVLRPTGVWQNINLELIV